MSYLPRFFLLSITKYYNRADKEITHHRFQKEIMDYLFASGLICVNRRGLMNPHSCQEFLLFHGFFSLSLLTDFNYSTDKQLYFFPHPCRMAENLIVFVLQLPKRRRLWLLAFCLSLCCLTDSFFCEY